MTDAASSVVLYANGYKYLKSAFISICAFFIVYGVVRPKPTPDNVVFIDILLGLTGLITVYSFLKYFTRRRDYIEISDDRLVIPRLFRQPVPWKHIAGVELTSLGERPIVRIEVAPDFEVTPSASPLLARFRGRGSPDAGRFDLVPGNYGLNLNGFLRLCHARMALARGDAAAAQVAWGDDEATVPQEPRAAPALAKPKIRIGPASWGLIAALIAVFTCEVVFSIGGVKEALAPGISTLTALGGSNSELIVQENQWWRLATAPLLHGDLIHLVSNLVGLFLICAAVEMMIGWCWFLMVFFVTGMAGSAASMLWFASNVIGIGASGGICGLLAAGLVVSGRSTDPAMRKYVRSAAAQSLASTLLIPLLGAAQAKTGHPVDFMAHTGGAAAGALIGLGLWTAWPIEQRWPLSSRLATGAVITYVLVVAGSLYPIVQQYRIYSIAAVIAPSLPSKKAELNRKLNELQSQYPRDPRLILLKASKLEKAGDFKGVENELRKAIADRPILDSGLFPDLEPLLHFNLAATILNQDRRDEALAIMKPFCDHKFSPATRDIIDTNSMCPK